MWGDWKWDCRPRTLVDAALAGSQALASFFSAPISLFDSGKATATTTSQKPTTNHLDQRPAGISAILLAPLIDAPCPRSRLPRARSLSRNHGPPAGRKRIGGHAWQRRSPSARSL